MRPPVTRGTAPDGVGSPWLIPPPPELVDPDTQDLEEASAPPEDGG